MKIKEHFDIAVEAKHARWDINCDGYYPYCTNCGYEPPWVKDRDMRTPYCPNCGARMGGTPKERGADKPKTTCLNCKHLMFSDMYGECNKQLRMVNPNDTCQYAEPRTQQKEG